MKRLLFYIKLYPFFVSCSIQSKIAYKADFIIGMVASILMQLCGFIFIATVFSDIPEINGWTMNELIFIYGMVSTALGLNEFLFAGTWAVGKHIQQGTLDRLLIRPISTMFSVLAADVTFHGLGSVLFGLVTCIIALVNMQLVLSIGMVFYWLLVTVCGALIIFAFDMIMATLSFWVVNSQSAMMICHSVIDFAKYPASIFGDGLRFVISFIIPFAFIGFYPSTFILGKSTELIFWLGPILAAIACVTVARLFWNFALTKYQSAGG